MYVHLLKPQFCVKVRRQPTKAHTSSQTFDFEQSAKLHARLFLDSFSVRAVERQQFVVALILPVLGGNFNETKGTLTSSSWTESWRLSVRIISKLWNFVETWRWHYRNSMHSDTILSFTGTVPLALENEQTAVGQSQTNYCSSPRRREREMMRSKRNN